MRTHTMWEDLHLDIWTPILEPLGDSLGSACAASPAWAKAAGAGGGTAFRPLSCVPVAPSPGRVPAPLGRQGEVARSRRAGVGGTSWQELGRVASSPASVPATWRSVGLSGARPSHRHSVAVCGAPPSCLGGGADAEAALLFGGNVSNSVAGNWRTTDELFLAQLPGALGKSCSLTPLSRCPGAAWPCSRWGASLTSLAPARYLLGGWSAEGDASVVWSLRFREAAVEWSPLASPPPLTSAFHTATAIDDGKRLALVGGLAGGQSAKGIWIFDSGTESWSRASPDGPSCAGHAAGAAGGCLAIFSGVKRSPGRRGDGFSGATSFFDLRAGSWDSSKASVRTPIPRRNPAHATIGRHLLISGGWDDSTSQTLSDAWALDVPRGTWRELRCEGGPELEAHKAVVSGFEVFCFGGHSRPGEYPSRRMSVHSLLLGLGREADGLSTLTDVEGQSVGPECSDNSGDSLEVIDVDV